MKSRNVRLLVVTGGCVALVVLGWTSWILLREELWIAQLKSPNESSRAEAAAALASAGTTRAIPAILATLKWEDEYNDSGRVWSSREPLYLFEALDRLTIPAAVPVILRVLNDPERAFRKWAAEALGRLEVRSSEMLAALQERLLNEQDSDVWVEVAISLQRFGQRAVPVFVETLEARERAGANADVLGDRRSTLVRTLTQLGPLARGAVPATQKALANDPERYFHDFRVFRALDPIAWRGLAEDFSNRWKLASPEQSDWHDDRSLEYVQEGREVLAADPGIVEALPILEPLLRHESFSVRVATARFLALLKQPARGDFLQVLTEVLLERDGEWEWTLAPGAFVEGFQGGLADLQALCATLHSRRWEREVALIYALAEVERHRPTVLELVREGISRGDQELGRLFLDPRLLLALARAAPVGPELLHHLEAAFRSEGTMSSGVAAYALALHGRGGEDILNTLARLFEPAEFVESEIQEAVREGLSRSKSEPAATLFLDVARLHTPRDAKWHELLLSHGSAAIPILAAAARDEENGESRDKEVHLSAMRALEQMPITAAEIPVLRELLADRDAELRAIAAFALGKLGPGVTSAADALRSAVADADPAVRILAASALTHDRAEARAATAVLRRELDLALRKGNGGRLDPMDCIMLLERSNPAPDIWTDARRSEDKDLRDAAARLQETPLPDLLKALRSSSCFERLSAFEALAARGSRAHSAIPALIDHFRRSDGAAHASYALSRIGVDAVAPLILALEDPSIDVRAWAAWTFGGLGEPAVAAVPALLRRLEDASGLVRAAAAESLGRIGPPARSALPALEQLKTDADEAVHRLALFAVRRINTAGASTAPVRFVPDIREGSFCGNADDEFEGRFHRAICTR